MKHRTLLKTLATLAVGLAVLLSVSLLTATQNNVSGTPYSNEVENQIEVTLRIEGLYDAEHITISQDSSVLTLLAEQYRNDPALMMRTTEYEGLGTLITGLAGKENGAGDKYWQYRVNGVLPQVGADQYLLSNGDDVEWFFEISSF
ncbi:MAG: DUF4430 domain-containing protein [Patescibacteria group bacterium]